MKKIGQKTVKAILAKTLLAILFGIGCGIFITIFVQSLSWFCFMMSMLCACVASILGNSIADNLGYNFDPEN